MTAGPAREHALPGEPRRPVSLSVCIPAHNEAPGIARTLDSVDAARAAVPARASEIVVCANACTDATVAAVRDWAAGRGLACAVRAIDGDAGAEADGPVTVLDTARAGKANAWNQLRARARGDLLVFADADVVVAPDAVRLLVEALDGAPAMLAAGATILPPPDARGLLVRRMAVKMKEFAAKPSPYINGPLYAIRRRAVERIPEAILHEDAYLSMVVGPERTVRVREAVAYQAPPAVYRDYFRRRVRDNLSDLQLESLYGEQYRDFRRRIRDPRTRRQRDGALTAAERAFKRWSFAQTWALKLVDRAAARRARALFRRGRLRWYTIGSTKLRQGGG